MLEKKFFVLTKLLLIISRIFVCTFSSKLRRNPPTNISTKMIFIFVDLYLGVPVGTPDSFL